MNYQKLDILAIGVHPDDVELSCGGTIAKEIYLGKKVGVLHLTEGELGTRGSNEIRLKEADKASKILGIHVQEFLNIGDGFFETTENNLRKIGIILRKYRPDIVLLNAVNDRHPDHARASTLCSRACFLSGLSKVELYDKNGNSLKKWRPSQVYHYIQWKNLTPDFVVDITGFMEIKKNACLAYASQFYNEKSDEPETLVSSKNFLDSIEYRAKDLGRIIGVEHAEGFTVERFVGVDNLSHLI
ncbi:MAG: bacillithiol biosynthesis deacetylase BshB1 [Flavobacteriales bacterium]